MHRKTLEVGRTKDLRARVLPYAWLAFSLLITRPVHACAEWDEIYGALQWDSAGVLRYNLDDGCQYYASFEFRSDGSLIRRIDAKDAPAVWKETWGLSPDGRYRVTFERNKNSETIWLSLADGSQKHRVVRGDKWLSEPVWAPDSRRLAYTTEKDVFVVDTAGAVVRRFHLSVEFPGTLQWTADSKRLLSDNYGSLLVLDLVSGMKRVISSRKQPLAVDLEISDAVWSPDGQVIAFRGFVGDEPNRDITILLLDSDEKGLRQLPMPAGMHAKSPAWSPQGDRLAFVTLGASGDEVWISDLTNEATPLVAITREGKFVNLQSGKPVPSEWTRAASTASTPSVKPPGTVMTPRAAVQRRRPLWWLAALAAAALLAATVLTVRLVLRKRMVPPP